jgi:erythronate-4-phosphate dehydrogenase
LLAGSSVRFLATATIGYDHIDTAWCEKAGISWANAPGCNSKSVEQYVASVLCVLSERYGFRLRDKTIGVVGVGHVGSKVARWCQLMGMKVLLNDPPRAREEGEASFCSLQEIVREADIITLHVPLNRAGVDATFHLADQAFFQSLSRKPILINSCRGEVTETAALKEAVRKGLLTAVVLDCWEHEPDIDRELLQLADVATPHIAGYSRDRKAIGTGMSVQDISRFFGLGLDDWMPSTIEPPLTPMIELDGSGLNQEQVIAKAIWSTYDVRQDDRLLREHPDQFEYWRGHYPVRREFPAYSIKTTHVDTETQQKLIDMGFHCLDKSV